MPETQATMCPVYGQAYPVAFKIVSLATGSPITGGLAGLTTPGNCQVAKDGGAWTNTANSPVEIGASGYGYLNLTSAEMTANHIVVRIAATNSNAVEFSAQVMPASLGFFAGRADAQSPLRFEQYVQDIYAVLMNQVVVSGAAHTVCNADGTPKVSGTDVMGDTTATKGKLS